MGWRGLAELLSPKTASKIGCFAYAAYGKSPAWRLNSALTGVKQRRQNVRENFRMRHKRNSTIFSQVFRESNSARPCHPPAARARNPEPWTRQMPIRKASELGGSNTNYENKRMTLFYYLPSLRICSALRRQSHPGTLQSLRWGWCLLVLSKNVGTYDNVVNLRYTNHFTRFE